MEITLQRKELYQVTCVTGKSLGLLPGSDKKKCHKVVVGADNGVVTCFRIKKGEAVEEYTTSNLDYPVSKVFIGGPVEKRDRVFYTSAQTIRGVNKKGKEFFKFNTDGTETLRGLCIEDTKIWTSGEYMYNFYVDTKDAGYYMAPDRINDLLLLPILNHVDPNPVLACQDRHVRVLDINKLHFEAFVDGSVLSLCRFSSKAGYADLLTGSGEKELLFGTDNGLVGQLCADPKSVRPGWVVANVRGLGGVTCLLSHDVTKDGKQDVVVARDDGELQVLTQDQGGEPVQAFTKSVNECIQGMDVGRVTTTNFDEVVLTTYSGKVLSFTTEAAAEGGSNTFQSVTSGMQDKELKENLRSTGGGSAVDDDDETAPSSAATSIVEEKKKKGGISSLFRIGSKKNKDAKEDPDKSVSVSASAISGEGDKDEDQRTDPKERERKIVALRKDVEVLREKVKEQREGFSIVSKENVPVSTRSKVKHSLLLDPQQACYKLNLESEMPIDIVALQSSLPITLLDPGTSVPSISPLDPKNDNMLLATLRIMGTNNRVQVSLMALEGHYGTLTAFVVTRVAPKVCHLVECHVKPLSLHKQVPWDDARMGQIPCSELRMSGTFGTGQMHAWVGSCFPSIPPKVPEGISVKYMFESTYVGTLVSAEYSKGEATFRSSNLSVLALIKDVISKEAALSKAKLDIKSPTINEGCVLHMLQLLNPKLEKLLKLKEAAKYLNALNEVAAQEGTTEFLSKDMQDMVARSDEIREEHKDNEKHITFMEHVLEQFFMDRFKFKGINVKHRVGEVHALVENYSWEGLTTLFATS